MPTGPELFTNFGDWTLDATFTGSGDTVVIDNDSGGVDYAIKGGFVIGKYYTVTYTVSNYVDGAVGLSFSNGAINISRAANGTYTETAQKTITANLYVYAGNTTTADITIDSIREADHGANVDAVKYFPYENGNTVSSGVVTEAQGPAIADLPGVLIEGARTNVLPDSGNFPNWTNVNSVDVANYATGPDGTTSATRLIDDAGGGTGPVYVSRAVVLSTTTQYTAFVIAKKDQLDWVALELNGFAGSVAFAYFDLTNGVVGATTGANNDSESITLIGSGWYVCSVTFTTAADGVGAVRAYASSGNNITTVDRDGTSSILIWGAQVEAGAFPSTSIETGASAATRNADILTFPAAGNADSFPMTIYAEVTPQQIGAQGYVMDVADGANNRASLSISSAGKANIEVFSGGASQASVTGTTTLAVGTTYKLAAVIAANHVELYVDGTSEGTPDDSVTVPASIASIYIGQRYVGDLQPYAFIGDVRAYQRELSASQVAAL